MLHYAPAFWSGFVRGLPVAVAITRCNAVQPAPRFPRFVADPFAFALAGGLRCSACSRALLERPDRDDRASTLHVHILWPEGAP